LGTARVHILPNVLPTVAVQLGASAAATIVGEAGLAFVGFGPRDGVSLGGALDQAVAGLFRAPLLLGVAGLAVFLGSAALVRASTVFSPRKRG
jgi:peptide/nickel transport system permease protein